MKILDYNGGDKLVFDETTNKGEVVKIATLEEQIIQLESDIAEIEKDLKDDKKMLEWARQEYGASMGLDDFKKQLAEKQALLEKIK